MTETMLIDIANQSMQLALMISLPLLIVSLIIGLLVSLFQVATSLQDVTLTFVPKIIAVGLTLILAAHWILQMLVGFTHALFSDFSAVIR